MWRAQADIDCTVRSVGPWPYVACWSTVISWLFYWRNVSCERSTVAHTVLSWHWLAQGSATQLRTLLSLCLARGVGLIPWSERQRLDYEPLAYVTIRNPTRPWAEKSEKEGRKKKKEREKKRRLVVIHSLYSLLCVCGVGVSHLSCGTYSVYSGVRELII